MRLIFVSALNGYRWGGSEELWSQAAVRLAQAGHEVSALTEKWSPMPAKIAALRTKGVALRLRDSTRGALAKAVFQKFTGWRPKDLDFEWLIEQKPDLVVISQGGIDDGLQAMNLCRAAKLPFLVIIQCNSDYVWPTDIVAAELALAYRGAIRVCCVSQNNLKLLELQIGEALPNACVVWNPNNVANAGVLPWPQSNEVARLACVGRLEPGVKGQDVLFKALALPIWHERPWELNLYGDGTSEHSLRQMAERLQLDRVNFRGHVENIADIWRSNHMLVMPSRQEGMPLALIEAMSCGRPAVLTDVGGNTELCVNDETGFIASIAALGPFSDALERAWTRRSEWQNMGLLARQRIIELVPKDPVGDFCELITRSSKDPLARQFNL